MKLDKIIAVRTGKTVYKDGGRVIKVFENGYSKADILNEALNQARIEETGLNIPKISRCHYRGRQMGNYQRVYKRQNTFAADGRKPR